MALTLVTPPVGEPVSRDEVKLHARITDPSQDERVDRFIASARQYAENRLGRQLLNATWRLTLERFPQGCVPEDYRVIILPRPPLVSVTHIKYYAVDGTLQTLPAGYYVVDTDHTPGRVQLKANVSWPETEDRLGAVQITFVAGYGSSPALVPADIRHAIETLAAHAYEHREAVVETESGVKIVETPLLANALLDLQRVEMYLY